MRKETGWTYAQIGDLTFPQLQCVLLRGRTPQVLTDAADIKDWITRVARGQAG